MSRLTLRSELDASALDASELDAALDLRRALPTSSRVDILERARDALQHAREHHGTNTERVCVETLAPALRGALVPTLLLSGELGGELGEAIVAVLEEALAAMTSAHFLGECSTSREVEFRMAFGSGSPSPRDLLG